MKREFSAGGIVYKLTTENGKPTTVWLICKHSQYKKWVFPKGLIGDTKKDETKEETAVREVEEETGISAEIVGAVPTPVSHWYVLDKEKRYKTVYYFLMKHLGGDFDKRDHEMMDVRWVNEQKVAEMLAFKNDKNAFSQALKIYNTIKNNS